LIGLKKEKYLKNNVIINLYGVKNCRDCINVIIFIAQFPYLNSQFHINLNCVAQFVGMKTFNKLSLSRESMNFVVVIPNVMNIKSTHY